MPKKILTALLPLVVGLTGLTTGVTVGLWARPALAQDQQAGLPKLKPWKDPKENAFSVEAPEGWSVGGGLTRNGASNFRQSVQAFRNEGDLLVQIGDAGLPPFVPLDADMAKAGLKEGQTITVNGDTQVLLMHPLSADEFNTWYAKTRLESVMDNFKVGIFHNEKELTSKYTEIQQKESPLKVILSVAETAFTGKLKANGQEVGFVVFSVVIRSQGADGTEAWLARPIMLGWARGEQEAANKRSDLIALTDLMGFWRDNPQWIQEYDKKRAEHPGPGVKGVSPGLHASIMGSYWKSVDARYDVIRDISLFLDHIPDGSSGNTPPPASNNPFGGIQ